MPETTTLDLAQLCDSFAELAVERSEHESNLDTVKGKMDELSKLILQRMQETGISRLRSSKHERTIFLRRQLWAKAKEGDKEAAMGALREAGLGDMIYETFNTNTLSKYIRDLANEQEADLPTLPPELAVGVEVSEKFDVRAVKSK